MIFSRKRRCHSLRAVGFVLFRGEETASVCRMDAIRTRQMWWLFVSTDSFFLRTENPNHVATLGKFRSFCRTCHEARALLVLHGRCSSSILSRDVFGQQATTTALACCGPSAFHDPLQSTCDGREWGIVGQALKTSRLGTAIHRRRQGESLHLLAY